VLSVGSLPISSLFRVQSFNSLCDVQANIATPLEITYTDINTVQELAGMTMTGNYRLVGNITITASDSFPGIGTRANPFQGRFVVDNPLSFMITITQDTVVGDVWGLFRYVGSGAYISGVSVTGSVTNAGANTVIGGVVGVVVGGEVYLSHVRNQRLNVMAASGIAGGLVGRIEGGNVTIHNPAGTANPSFTATGGTHAGGIIGLVSGGAVVTITNDTTGGFPNGTNDTTQVRFRDISLADANYRGLITGGIIGNSDVVFSGLANANPHAAGFVFTAYNIARVTIGGLVAGGSRLHILNMRTATGMAPMEDGSAGDFRWVNVSSANRRDGSRVYLQNVSHLGIIGPNHTNNWFTGNQSLVRNTSGTDIQVVYGSNPMVSFEQRPNETTILTTGTTAIGGITLPNEHANIYVRQDGTLVNVGVFYRISYRLYAERRMDIRVSLQLATISPRDLVIHRTHNNPVPVNLHSHFTVNTHPHINHQQLFFRVVTTEDGRVVESPKTANPVIDARPGMWTVHVYIYVPDLDENRTPFIMIGDDRYYVFATAFFTLQIYSDVLWTPPDDPNGGGGGNNPISPWLIGSIIVFAVILGVLFTVWVIKKRQARR